MHPYCSTVSKLEWSGNISHDLMLKKRHRIRNSAEIQSMFSQAARAKIGDLFLLYKKTPKKNKGNDARATIIVSKKYSLSAVKRNTQRRLLSEALRRSGVLQCGFDIVLTYTNKGKMLSYRDSAVLMEQVIKLLSTKK